MKKEYSNRVYYFWLTIIIMFYVFILSRCDLSNHKPSNNSDSGMNPATYYWGVQNNLW